VAATRFSPSSNSVGIPININRRPMVYRWDSIAKLESN
jgi:hypothetical protein